jgi:AraC-like DNA-binding protein
LANRLVPVDDLLGSFAGELTERLAAAETAGMRHAVAQRLLARRLCDDHTTPPEVAHALGRLRATYGAVRVETLASEVGWSRRHLAARFREAVGLTPKALARLIRVEHAARRVRAGEPLAEVAYAAGYADQPHFIRDFSRVTGMTPGEFASLHEEGGR